MYKVDVPVDQSIGEAVERRRSAATARKARIFDTRLRVMGLDLDALNQQVQEKKHQQTVERQRDTALDKLAQYYDDLLLQQDIDERERRAALHTDLTQFWATQQRVEDSSDADLKCGLKGAFGITNPGGELGPASMQIFEGEGSSEPQTWKTKETERDLRMQKEDNLRRCMRNQHREMLESRELVHRDLREVQQAALEEECKKAACIALDNYNQALAAERAEKLKEQHRREERDNLTEMVHILTSDMMTECADTAKREAGGGKPSRMLTDRWKGMSPKQLRAIHMEREQQCLEKQVLEIEDAAWDLQLLKLSTEAEEKETRAAELRRRRRIQMDEYNMQLAREQVHAHYSGSVKLYTNKPTNDYFHQFNASSR
uniref:RIB43A-like with coiled-coils protein 1 n=1 Tax=Echeneis naucrates TaxID=173247 RepID=A0A665X5Y4_ECHNA